MGVSWCIYGSWGRSQGGKASSCFSVNCGILGFTTSSRRFLACNFTSVILIFLSCLNIFTSHLQELSFCTVNGLEIYLRSPTYLFLIAIAGLANWSYSFFLTRSQTNILFSNSSWSWSYFFSNIIHWDSLITQCSVCFTRLISCAFFALYAMLRVLRIWSM